VFAALLPGVLGVIPVAALAGLLVHVGCELVPVRELGVLWRGRYRGEVVLGVTALATIVAWNLIEGVLVGLALVVAKRAWDVSHVHVETEDRGEAGGGGGGGAGGRERDVLAVAEAAGCAGRGASGAGARRKLSGLRHMDHACAAALEACRAERTRAKRDGRSGAGRSGPEGVVEEGAVSDAAGAGRVVAVVF
jgi:hypothetical protein